MCEKLWWDLFSSQSHRKICCTCHGAAIVRERGDEGARRHRSIYNKESLYLTKGTRNTRRIDVLTGRWTQEKIGLNDGTNQGIKQDTDDTTVTKMGTGRTK